MTDKERAEKLRDDICNCIPTALLDAVGGDKWAAALLGYEDYKRVQEYNTDKALAELPYEEVVNQCSAFPIMNDESKLWNLILYISYQMNRLASVRATLIGVSVYAISVRYGLPRNHVILLGRLFNMEMKSYVGVECLYPMEGCYQAMPDSLPEKHGLESIPRWLMYCCHTTGANLFVIMQRAVRENIIPMPIWMADYSLAREETLQMLRADNYRMDSAQINKRCDLFNHQIKSIKTECFKSSDYRYWFMSANNLLMLPEASLKEITTDLNTLSKQSIETKYGMDILLCQILEKCYRTDPSFAVALDWDKDMVHPNDYSVYQRDAAEEEARYES